MKPKIFLWLPGGVHNAQHQRLRLILTPLCDALAEGGHKAALRSIRNDGLTADKGGVHIWLATELGEVPPRDGVNILWFLGQMKVTTHPVLLAHDAILTASPAHADFLRAWLGDLRHIGVAGWPVAPLTIRRPSASAAKTLTLEPPPEAIPTPTARIEDLPAAAAALQAHFRAYQEIVSHPPLRERMCGFYRYEEIIALLAGCSLRSQERRGLPGPLDKLIDYTGAATYTPRRRARSRRNMQRRHDPTQIAEAIIAAVDAAQAHRGSGPDRASALPHGFAPARGPAPRDEWRAFTRDAAYLLDHPIIASLQAPPEDTAAIDQSEPWDILARLPRAPIDLPRPWTDLSLLRHVCDTVQGTGLELLAQDRARIAAMVQILRRYKAALSDGAIALGALPQTPWAGVSTASREPRRSFNDLSRVLNGHCLYRFGQRVGKPKVLSPALLPAPGGRAQVPDDTAIFLHAFYIDTAQEIIAGLAPELACCPLHVTTDSPAKAAELDAILTERAWPRFEITLVENVGRDIYPKLAVLRDVHMRHGTVLHLHTKKSPHSPALHDWGKTAVARLAGGPEAVAQVFAAFAADPKLGIIYPDPPQILYPAMSWLRNLRLAELLASMAGLGALPPDATLDFPAGSMFWTRTEAIAPILKLSIDAAAFAREEAQEDGTLSHAIERLLGAACLAQGFGMARI
jgi:hypothetical protein